MLEKIKNNLSLVACILGVFASLMIFFPALSYDLEYFELEKMIGGDIEGMMFGITGWGVCFGMDIAGERLFDFSLKCLGAYCLPVMGVICLVSAENKRDKGARQSAFLCFLVGAIFLFVIPFLVEGMALTTDEGLEDMWDLGIGALSGAIACALSAVCLWFELQISYKNSKVFPET